MLLNLLKVAFGFGLVVFIHEFGHFLAARLMGVRVQRFAIGFDLFGLRLATFQRGGTEYVLGALPIGGYVKMLGHNEASLEAEERASREPDSFQSRSVGARVFIISAGVIANFLSAFALFVLAARLGYHITPAVVGPVELSALQAGLRPGDTVVEVDGAAVEGWEDLLTRVAPRAPGESVPVRLRRGDAMVDASLPVERPDGAPFSLPPFFEPVVPVIGSVSVGEPAAKAGMEPGDRLLAVDGVAITGWDDFAERIHLKQDQPIAIELERAGERRTVTATPRARPAAQTPGWTLGFEPDWPARIAWVDPDSPAAQVGLRAGDALVEVAGQPVQSWPAAWRAVELDVAPDAPLAVVVERDGARLDALLPARPDPGWGLGMRALPGRGFVVERPEALVVGTVAPGGPAASAGLQPGDVIERVEGLYDPGDGTPRTWEAKDPSWTAVQALLERAVPVPGGVRQVRLWVRRGDRRIESTVPLAEAEGVRTVGFLGVGPSRARELVVRDWAKSMQDGLRAPVVTLGVLISGLRGMVQGRVDTSNITGPIGILHTIYLVAKQSFGDLLRFLGMLSVNLALVNFLPIPVTDGGHFLFLMYEKVKGRRMDEELESRFQWAGLVFILMVLVYATFNDIGRF